jgi:hypothetical protein
LTKGGEVAVGDISSLESADRIEIFRHIAADGSDGVNANMLASIACDNFHTFLDFCDRVFAEKDSIEDVSATLDEDNQLTFNIIYKK